MRRKVNFNLALFYFLLLLTVSCLLLTPAYAGDVPGKMSYQGFVKSGGATYNGTGYFKFAVINSSGGTSYWSNDGTSSAGSEPSAAVSNSVSNGIFNITLGDTTITNMNALDKDIFANGVELYLRTWFSTNGSSFEQLSPDKQITSSAYALNAYNVYQVDGATINNAIIGGTTPAAGTFSSMTATTADVNAGTIDGTTIGATTPAAGTFTTGTITTADINGGAIDGVTIGGSSAGLGIFSSLIATSNLSVTSRLSFDDTDLGTYLGYQAGNAGPSGDSNSFFGYQAGYTNTTGSYNTAVGKGASYTNATTSYNTAVGYEALYSCIVDYNTAIGYYALRAHTTGNDNVAVGNSALYSDTNSQYNVAIGDQALYLTDGSGSGNTALGFQSGNTNTTGDYNTFIGFDADASSSSLSNVTAIGYGASVNASNKVRIGDANVTVIEGAVDWSFISDIRLKRNIADNDIGLEFISRLRPVHFEMRKGHEGIIYDGFIAQEVEEVMDELGITFSGLVKPDNPENMYSLSYGAFVVPLVNAVKELNTKAHEQQEQTEEQQEQIKNQQKQIDQIDLLKQEVELLKQEMARLKGYVHKIH